MPQTVEQASKTIVQDQGQAFIKYHNEFINKSLCEKLWILTKALPTYVWYKYFAPNGDMYTYRALQNYLAKKVNNHV